ncbi:glycine betaine ABC transporter substrate-binding protein [Pseudomonas guariconensis]|uniref:glycine betaine ABC transporter substrate-binding protein n=1 Tax=Pseudomonas TaxID=286 RepID=UPI001CE48E85|nr:MULTISPECIES: glycine betaine ABC transporter substrate-binding protein [Pseudomonas]MCO7638269.1 glycine betaine ABC transporter substrate-binding protein [Pseudomonas sp. S 311-6]MCO7514160.1 glycine betaine ABC transporter substrate-binding protein [Pseudomonas putida]MCO7564331.1 glycine betaine ABC transporter substrate-binding protein [Pseudomonas mosselii]MCO7605213.1 glycine betaine ABC transporter substrate-binding protein [Pseudomonas guariconensis]MCO7615729.1 glycine betaine ABC
MFARGIVALLTMALLGAAQAAQPSVVVGGKKFTEQQLIAEMTAQLLRSEGYKVDKRPDLGSSVLRSAQENGQVDIYWEYTGTSLIIYNKVKERLDAQQTYARVKRLDAAKGLTWLQPSEANNTYAFAMREEEAKAKGIATLSDLATKVNDGEHLKFASNAEFYSRPDGLRPLQDLYAFTFERDDIIRMDGGLTYQALREGQADVALVLSTDGRVPAFGFVILEDDKGFFPSYALTPVVRTQFLEAHPGVAELLNTLSASLTSDTMATLNSRVDVGRESIEKVASEYLSKNNMLAPAVAGPAD